MSYLSNPPRKFIAFAGLVLCTQVANAGFVRTITEVWGGPHYGCATAGPIPDLAAFFNGAGGLRVLGGNVACGLTGATSDQTAATGPLFSNQSLPPVSLSTVPGNTFAGSASASAIFGSLGAAAHGIQVGDATNLQATSSTAAAFFKDTLTVKSPLVQDLGNGFVRYVFKLDGSLSTPSAPPPFQGGYANTQLNFSHANGGSYTAARLFADPRSPGVFTAMESSPSTWTLGASSVSGSGLFGTTLYGLNGAMNQPIQFGVPWDFELGLLAQTYGTGNVNFQSTATIADIQFFNAAGVQINNFTLTSASGTNYLAPATAVPEPQTWALTGLGLALMALLRHVRSVRRHKRGGALVALVMTRSLPKPALG